jgi:hypothetical protein
MTVLLAVVWFVTGAMAGWGVSTLRAATAAARAREQMRREIRCWQAETERFKAVADRVAQEKESWAAGVRQGRDDVITIVPLLSGATGDSCAAVARALRSGHLMTAREGSA